MAICLKTFQWGKQTEKLFCAETFFSICTPHAADFLWNCSRNSCKIVCEGLNKTRWSDKQTKIYPPASCADGFSLKNSICAASQLFFLKKSIVNVFKNPSMKSIKAFSFFARYLFFSFLNLSIQCQRTAWSHFLSTAEPVTAGLCFSI